MTFLFITTFLSLPINPQDQEVEIYRQGGGVEVVKLPGVLSGEDVLPGFELNYPD